MRSPSKSEESELHSARQSEGTFSQPWFVSPWRAHWAEVGCKRRSCCGAHVGSRFRKGHLRPIRPKSKRRLLLRRRASPCAPRHCAGSPFADGGRATAGSACSADRDQARAKRSSGHAPTPAAHGARSPK